MGLHDDAEDVLASRLDRIVICPAGHEQYPIGGVGAPHPDLFDCYGSDSRRNNVQSGP